MMTNIIPILHNSPKLAPNGPPSALLPAAPSQNASDADIETFLSQVRESMLSVSESIETVNYKPFTITSTQKGQEPSLAFFERNLEYVWNYAAGTPGGGLIIHFIKKFLEIHDTSFIAGGFPRLLLSEDGVVRYKTLSPKESDIDLYFGDKEQMILALKEIMTVYRPEHSFYGKSFAYTFTDGSHTLQLIYAGNTPDGQISLFDFENVMFAFNKDKRWYNSRIIDLEKTRTLSLANLNKGMLGSYLGRIKKYVFYKGYNKIDTVRDMTLLAATIVSDWKQDYDSPHSLVGMLRNNGKIKWPDECLLLFTAISDPETTGYIMSKLCNS